MTIQIFCPYRREAERDYVFDVIFTNWLNLPWVRVSEDRSDYCVRISGQSGEIRLPDSFFSESESRWLSDSMLPMHCMGFWDSECIGIGHDFETSKLPIIFGTKTSPLSSGAHSIAMPVDIFGSTFFMLSGYDELVSSERDAHNRFQGKHSVAYKRGFLDHPIIDQYVEVLLQVMENLWPALQRKRRDGKVVVSCDVDLPFDPRANSITGLLKGVLASALRGQGLQPTLGLFRNYAARQRGSYKQDPYFTFDWYMTECEKHNRVATFYFIADSTAGSIDGDYDIFDQKILYLLRSILQRGHEVGVHGSYNSYRSGSQIKFEREKLNNALTKAGVSYQVEGSRQHYLRWDLSKTPDYLDEAGYTYDTTGSYADLPGFRYGTAKPFPMWSWKSNRPLKLLQKPLICMECSVIADRYLGLGYTDEAYVKIHQLKSRAIAFGGDFTLLWHNNYLNNGEEKRLFKRLLS